MDTTPHATNPDSRPWLQKSDPETRWAVSTAIFVAMAFQLVFALAAAGWMWVIQGGLVVVELVLLVVLIRLNPHDLENETPLVRRLSWTLTGALIAANAATAVYLDVLILSTDTADNAMVLLGGGAAIFVTNVIAFALMYWEFDRGGPFARRLRPHERPHPDFLFPQMSASGHASHDWRSNFIDYLYVSLTNVTAFSPTDTMPLSRPAKMMMAAQSLVAFSTAVLVIARAVNVLG
jgi:hypothetical protein